MDFSLTDEQQLLLDSVDELMERYGTEQYFKECDEKHVWPQEFTDALLENGFQMLGVSCEEECSIEPSALRMTEPGVYEGGGVVLRPISDSYRLDAASLAARKLQILFRRGEGRTV